MALHHSHQRTDGKRDKKSTSWDPWGCVDCDTLDMTLCEPRSGVPGIFKPHDGAALLSRICGLSFNMFLSMVHGGGEPRSFIPNAACFPITWRSFLGFPSPKVSAGRGRVTQSSNTVYTALALVRFPGYGMKARVPPPQRYRW